MAEILLFPSERHMSALHRAEVQPFEAGAYAAETSADEGPEEEDAGSGISLAVVASLAAAPSQTLAVLKRKVEVLVARLAPDDEAECGLCAAEARLLKSVLHDVQAFAADAVFAAQGAEIWAAAPVG